MKSELKFHEPKDELRGSSTSADYLGDYLRGNVPINQLIPQHEYVIDTLKLGEEFEKNTQHMMLLTLDEASAILNELLISIDPVTTYAGNIKDGFDGVSNIRKLSSYYNDVNRLIYNFKGLGIKAIPYTYEGVQYIKITGYPGVRRILKGSRYGINNPQLLELSIGKAGRKAGIVAGARFCIYFSAAYRAFELIFKDGYTVIDFVGDIGMDAAKILVTIYATELAFALVSGIALVTGVTFPISAGVIVIVGIGCVISGVLLYIDDRYQLSSKLKSIINTSMSENAEVENWNLNNNPYFTILHDYGL